MAFPSNGATFLALSVQGVPIYSARGLRQSLTPIEQSLALRRSINGVLADISVPAFRKYQSTITGNDVDPPASDAVFPGLYLSVDCVAELSYKTSGGSASRTVVSGSSRVAGAFTYYRPQLTMRVRSLTWEQDEWGARSSWSLELEEV